MVSRHPSVTFSSKPPTTIPFESNGDAPDFNFLETIALMELPHTDHQSVTVMDSYTAASLGDDEYFTCVPTYAFLESNKEKWNCLMYAVYLGHEKLVHTILGDKPSLADWQDGSGRSALMMAASLGHAHILNYLIVVGADLDCQDVTKRTALHYAVMYKHHTCVDELILHQADTNAVDIEGMTPTLLACNYGYDRLLELLLKNGGDPAMTNWNGESGEYLATESGNPKMETVLRRWRLEQNDNAEVKNLSELLYFFKLEQHLPAFEKVDIDLMGFLTMTKDRLNSIVYDLEARNALTAVIDYFTPYGLDQNCTDRQQEYTRLFNEHVAKVEDSIADANRKLKERKEEEKRIGG